MHILDETCSFNRIYKLNSSITIDDTTVEDIRKNLTLKLGTYLQDRKFDFEVISPIPNTGKLYTPTLSTYLGLDHVALFEKVQTLRTLRLDASERRQYYEAHLAAVEENIIKYRNSHVLFVDEALLSGITLRAVTRLCREYGLTNYSFLFMSPPNYLSCPFKHIKPKNRIISMEDLGRHGLNTMVENLQNEFKARNIIFTPFELFKEELGGKNVCSLCFYNPQNTCV